MRSTPQAHYANEAQWKYMGDGGPLQYNYSIRHGLRTPEE